MELDSLELKVSAEAQSAEKALDSLIGKLQSFSKALGGINTTSISKNLENLAKVGGLKTVTKEVEDLGKTVDNVGKKKTKTEVKVDVKQGLEAIKELQSKFSDIGKGTQFNGNLSSLEKEYDKLSAKLDKLAEREQKALAIGTASTNDKAFQSLQYDIANTINKLAELETKIQSVKNQNTSQTANIPIFRWDNQNTGSTQNITENIEKSLKSIPETAKYSVEQAQKSLNEAISKVQNAQTNVEDFSQRISQARANLKNVEVSGKGMGTDEWDRAYIALQKVVSEAKQYKAALNERATGINTDISETDSLDTKVNKLREDLKQLKADGFGFGDTAFDKTYQQLNQAEKELAEYKARLTESETSTRSFGSTLKSAATGFSNFISKIKNAGAATLNFAKNVRNMKSPLKLALGQISKLGNSVARLYFKYMMLSRVAGALGKVLGISSDYVEEYNYFQKAIDKIAQENKGNYKKYGYDDAKSYADSFEDRLTTLTGKMTGYKIGKDGDLLDTGTASLGLDITQITNFEAQIAQMTNSVGMMGEASIATSKAMTMLAGDMSSLTNMPLDTVMKNFSSGLSGAAMAVKKYGMDISVAALQETALGLGVKKNVSDMTQAEKEYLRVITMLQQSKVAWGDLADTINQPANQFRMLKSNIKQCGLMLSRLFMPVIEKVLPWLNAMAMAVKDLMKHIGDLFGLKFKSIGGSSNDDTSSSYDDVSDSADDAADSINNAADAQKKFNKQLQGFDKLNNLTTNETSKGDNDSDKGNAGDTSGVLSDALINAVEDYEKRWNKAFKNMTSDADKLKEKIEKLFTTAWDTGDGTEIGEALATTLNKGIDWVNKNTSKWAKGLKKITSIMGTSLNGFVKKFKWKGLGKAIGNSIKAALEAETNFFKKVNWVNLGKGLSKTLNSAIKTGVLQSYFKSMASKLRAAIETAFGAITTFDFKGLGKALGQGINDFFKTMNKKNKQTGLNGWQELGKSLSDGIKGIADSITTALDTVDWEQVGQGIADFIGSIDWGGVVWSLGKMAKALIKAIGKTITAQTKKDPVSGVITIGILGFTLRKGWKKLLAILLGSKIGKSKLSVGLSRVFAVIKAWSISKISKAAKALATKIKSRIGKIVVTFKNVYASIKKWIASGAKISDLIKAVKTALGIQKGLTLPNIAVKIATKLPTLAFPDMAADELARNIDEWFTNKIWKPLCKKVSWLDENSPMGVFQVPVKLAIKIGTSIKDFFGDTWDDTTAMTSGIDVGNDMANGVLKGFADALVYPVNFLYNLIVKPVKEALGIHSPSTVFKEIAEFCVAGFMNNFNLKDKIKEKLQNLGKATIDLVLNAKAKLVTKASELWGELKKKWNSFTKKLSLGIECAVTFAKDIGKKAKEWWDKHVHLPKLSIKIATPKEVLKKVQEWWSNVKKWWKENVHLPKIDFPTMDDITGQIEEKWNDLKDWWDEHAKLNIHIPSVGDFVDSVKEGWQKVTEWWGKKKSLSKVTIGVTSIYDKIKTSFINAKEWLKKHTKNPMGNIKITVSKIYSIIKDRFNAAKEWIKGRVIKIKIGFNMTVRAMKKAVNTIIGWINRYIIKNLNKISIKIPPIKVLGKTLFGGKTLGFNIGYIEKFASGGFPEMGQLFIANEAGPELVGNLKGRKTAVVNNDQIVASVSQGVSDAVYNVMTPVLTSLVSSINRMNSSGTPLYVEGVSEGDIVKITQNANADYKKRYGKPLFA